MVITLRYELADMFSVGVWVYVTAGWSGCIVIMVLRMILHLIEVIWIFGFWFH
jgi:hypothetical protein